MSQLMIGFGRCDFSPDGSVSLNSTRTGTYLFDRLYASCVAWQEGDLTVLQYSLDLRSIYERAYNLIHGGVTEALGLPGNRIIISVTHNHSSPDMALLDRPQQMDWLNRIGLPAIIQAGKNALADLAPVTGAVAGTAQAPKTSAVRRCFRADGTLAGVASKKSTSPVVRHESNADQQLRVVRFFREGKKDLILLNYQVHAASCLSQYNDRISADIVGPIRKILEADGDAYAMYLQGACGNTSCGNKVPEEKADWPKDYYESGTLIGNFAKEALQNAKPLALGKLKFNWSELTCHVNHAKTHLAPKAEAIWEETDPEKKQQMMDEAGITSRYEVTAIIKRASFGATREMPLATLVCGELAMGFAPVELFDTCGKYFREASPCDMTFFCGYSMCYHCYVPSAKAFPNLGYEVLQCHYIPGTGEMIALELARQVRMLTQI